MKPYVFNNSEFDNLNSLALAYKENFDLGIEDIYANTKKLIKFVKQNTKNKERVKTIYNDIILSRYKNNALTFVIYDLLDVKEVIINGKALTFQQFIQLIAENPSKENALFAFLEDHGVTRCYERLEPTMKCFKDMYFVERNYDKDFTYLYLKSLFDFEIKETLDKKIMSIAIQNEECFRRASKLVRDNTFMLGIAHTYGFREAIAIINQKNGIFDVLKLFKGDSRCDVDEEQLRRVLGDTFYWWLYDNFDKYTAKGQAKQVISRLKRIKSEYDSYTKKKNNKEIAKITFDFYADISRKLYLAYLDFVYFYRAGLIVPVKGENSERFEMDKPYCRTYITEDYMQGRVIKLYNPNAVSQGPEVNPLTGEKIEREENIPVDIDDISDDAPLDELLMDDEDIYEREISYIRRNSRFAQFAIVIGFVNLVVAGLGAAFILFAASGSSKLLEAFRIVCTWLNVGVLGGASLLTIILGFVVNVLEASRIRNFEDYHFMTDANTNKEISLEDEAYLESLKEDTENIRKKVLKNTFVSSLLLSIVFVLSVSMVGLFGASELPAVMTSVSVEETLKNVLAVILIYALPVAIGGLGGLIIKHKGLIYGLIVAVAALAVAPLLVLIF